MGQYFFRYFLLLGLLLGFFNERTTAQGNTLLWQISGNGLQKPSFLFGTVHKICKEDYFWTDSMRKYFHRSDEVCFEIDFSNPFLIWTTLRKIQSDNGKTLKDIFTPRDFERVSAYLLKAKNLDIMMLNGLKPTVLLLLIQSDQIACEEFTSYEEEIKQDAQKFEKPMKGLETIESQIDILSSATEKEIVAFVLDIVNGRYLKDQSHIKIFEDLIALYKQENIKALYQLIESNHKPVLGKIEDVLDNRNKAWVPKFNAFSQNKSVFYAVGAGHLAGNNGLIQLLRNAGFTLTPIFSEPQSFDEILTNQYKD